MVGAAKDFDLDVEGLYNRGVRVSKPSLTFSSFLGKKQNKTIDIELEFSNDIIISSLYCKNEEDIYSHWEDNSELILADSELLERIIRELYKDILEKLPDELQKSLIERNKTNTFSRIFK